jgi:hypothetical protein
LRDSGTRAIADPRLNAAVSGVRIGDWVSGVYFARVQAANGLVGFAPFVLRPRRLGGQRVAVIMPIQTWQALLGRPFLNRSVPFNFRRYDSPFLHWLALNSHR